MALSRYPAFAMLALCSLVTRFIITPIAYVIDVGLSYFRAEAIRFVNALPSPALAISGHPLDAATQQSLRFEAGVPRRSAARNT